MSLTHVLIFQNQTASQAEERLNRLIEEYPEYEISYELLIESSVAFGNLSDTKYTLLVNFEQERTRPE